MKLGIEYDVLNALFLEQIRKPLRFFDGSRAHQNRLTGIIQLLNLIGRGEILFFLGAINQVWIFDPQQRLIGRDDENIKVINFAEFSGFGFRSSGHARQFFVHAEIILKGDGRKRLVLTLDLHAFFGFDRLVQTVRPAASRHQATRELINDNDFAVFHHVLDIAVIERVRLNRRLNVVLEVPIFGISNVADSQKLFNLFPAFIGDDRVAMLLVHDVITGHLLWFTRSSGNRFTLLQLGDDAIYACVLVG